MEERKARAEGLATKGSRGPRYQRKLPKSERAGPSAGADPEQPAADATPAAPFVPEDPAAGSPSGHRCEGSTDIPEGVHKLRSAKSDALYRLTTVM